MFSVQGAEEIVISSLLLIRKFEWLLNLSVVNFFTDKHWEKLPKIWQDVLRDMEPSEFQSLLQLDGQVLKRPTVHSKVWPLSILALKAASTRYSLPRYSAEIQDKFCNSWRDVCTKRTSKFQSKSNVPLMLNNKLAANMDMAHKSDSVMKKRKVENTCAHESILLDPVDTTSCLTHPKLKQIFQKHVKQKKRYEIEEFSKIVAKTAQSVNCKHIIDIGSGVGHLSRMLAYGYGLRVCGVEQQDSLTKQAFCLDLEIEATISKYITNVEMQKLTRPVHLNLKLDHETNSEQFIQSICTAFGNVRSSDLVCGIVGLHTCGDLAPILLRLFTVCPNILFLNNVGCCHMKLNTQQHISCFGYPMSRFLLSKKLEPDLSYEALEVACHANEAYWQRLCDGQFSDLKVNCYRAALEEILVRRFPALQHSMIASVKCTPELSFADYCTQALSRHNVYLSSEDVSSANTLQNLSEWKRVVNVGSLRLLLAPVVETIVLLDRLLYVREQGFSGQLMPIFNPQVSPRNHVIVATKSR